MPHCARTMLKFLLSRFFFSSQTCDSNACRTREESINCVFITLLFVEFLLIGGNCRLASFVVAEVACCLLLSRDECIQTLLAHSQQQSKQNYSREGICSRAPTEKANMKKKKKKRQHGNTFLFLLSRNILNSKCHHSFSSIPVVINYIRVVW